MTKKRKAKQRKSRSAEFRGVIGDLATAATRTNADREIDDKASDWDAQWFLDNPRMKARERPPLLGEFAWACPPGCTVSSVFVFEVEPGLRIRGPVFRAIARNEIN